jgi:hypothetical protein
VGCWDWRRFSGFGGLNHGFHVEDNRALDFGMFLLLVIVYLASRFLVLLGSLGYGIDYGFDPYCDRSQLFLLNHWKSCRFRVSCLLFLSVSLGLLRVVDGL